MNAKRNKKTTAFGIVSLILAGISIWQNPQQAVKDPDVLAAVSAGVGLIVAKDGDQTGVATPRQKKPKKSTRSED